jgi:zinc protease
MQTFAQLASSNDEHTSQSLADEFIRNFMQQEPIPGIAYENGLVQRFLPEITLADINGLARNWVPDRNRVVAVSGPKKAGVAVPDEAKLAAIIKNAGGGTLTPMDAVKAPFRRDQPKPGTRCRRRRRRPITNGAINGVRVAPTDDVQAGRDPVSAFSPARYVARERSGLHPAGPQAGIVAEGGSAR